MSAAIAQSEIDRSEFLANLRPGKALHQVLASYRPFDAIMVPTAATMGNANTASPAFLARHLIRFSGETTQFKTLDGIAGAFSDLLDTLTLQGRPGVVRVVHHADPDASRSRQEHQDNVPATLNIFVVGEPLGSAEELSGAQGQQQHGDHSDPFAALFGNPQQQQQDGSKPLTAAESKGPMRVESTLDTILEGKPVEDPQNASADSTSSSGPTSLATTIAQNISSVLGGSFSNSASIKVSPGRPLISQSRPTQVSSSVQRFSTFQERMRDPASKPIVKLVSSFVHSQQEKPEPTTGTDIRGCILEAMRIMKNIPVWSATEDDVDMAAEGLEKYLTTKLYEKCFCTSPKDKRENAVLGRKLGALRKVICADNLDAPVEPTKLPDWQEAKESLQMMNTYKCPRDKLVCGTNACVHVANALRGGAAAVAEGAGSDVVQKGADDMWPVVMLAVCEANPENFLANVRYIAEFRSPDRIESETAYNLTMLQAASEFWLTSQSHQLKMTDEEFDIALNNIFALQKRNSAASTPRETPRQLSPTAEDFAKESLADLDAAKTALQKLDSQTQVTQTLLGRSADGDGKSFDDLTVAELRKIVEESRQAAAVLHDLRARTKLLQQE